MRRAHAAQTGVEMEALTGVSVALLTIYDMCKAVDKEMRIFDVAAWSRRSAIEHARPSVHDHMQITVGIITDLRSREPRANTRILVDPRFKEAAGKSGWHVLAKRSCPTISSESRRRSRSFSDQGCGLILTTGGTGIAERDVTPEAIRGIMRVEFPGFGETMRSESLKITPNAILSRSLAAVVDRALVIALPGKPSGAVECLGFVQARSRTRSPSRSAFRLLVNRTRSCPLCEKIRP